MKSLEVVLAQAVESMKPATKTKYSQRTDGRKLPIEQLCNIAESLVAQQGEVREYIRRNNSGSYVEENTDASWREQSDSMILESIAKRTGVKAHTEVSEANLTPTQKQDFDFARAVGLSEAESLKVATSGELRG